MSTGAAGTGVVYVGRGRGGWWKQGNEDEESDKGNHGLGMDDLRNCQGMGAAHANRLQGLAITRSRKSGEFEMDCNSFHTMQLHLTTPNL